MNVRDLSNTQWRRGLTHPLDAFDFRVENSVRGRMRRVVVDHHRRRTTPNNQGEEEQKD